MSDNTNLLSPLVDSIYECGSLLWKLISNNPNKVNWREEFLALGIKNNEEATPKFLKCYEDDYRIEYLFTLPIGLTVEKVENSISRVATLHSKQPEYVSVERFQDKVKIVIDKGVFENELFRFEDLDFKPKKNALLIPVGYYLKEGKKTMLYLDLSASTQCHVLIGGSSGYGKTNIAKFMLTAVVTNYSYQDVNFIISDLKGTEFPLFANTKHCIRYTDSPEETVAIVKDLLVEMDKRYALLKENKCKDISSYNSKGFKLPRIIFFIDEFADLTLLAESGDIDSNVIPDLARLLQKGRSAGIHCMFSLQTAKATLIPTEIRNNMPITIGVGCRDGNQSKTVSGDSTDLVLLRDRPSGLCMVFGLPRFDNLNLVKSFFMPKDEEEMESILEPYYKPDPKKQELIEKANRLNDSLNTKVSDYAVVNKVSGFGTLDKKELFSSYGETRRPVAKKRQSHRSKKVKLDKLDQLK